MTKINEASNADLIRAGKLFPYNQNVALYHCPADQGVTIDGQVVPTLRSYSMNCFMGARDPSLGPIPATAGGFVPFYAKESDIPEPDQLWVLLEEDERSINDGFFITDPTGQIWMDFPAMSMHRHNYSYVLDFADGHSSIWRYSDPRSFQPIVNMTEQPGNPDLARLAAAPQPPTPRTDAPRRVRGSVVFLPELLNLRDHAPQAGRRGWQDAQGSPQHNRSAPVIARPAATLSL